MPQHPAPDTARTVLIVDDEQAIADTLTYSLENDGFKTLYVGLGRDAIHACQQQHIDLVILDIGLPDMTGFEVCKSIREFSDAPILFLSARNEEIDRIIGLEIGADDYICKPFSPREVVARVKANLKRYTGNTPSAVDSTPSLFALDIPSRKIVYCDHTLSLSRYEFELLACLIQQPERVFERETLMQACWDSPEHRMQRVIDTHIKSLRLKLKHINADISPIKTHRGVGYSIDVTLDQTNAI